MSEIEDDAGNPCRPGGGPDVDQPSGILRRHAEPLPSPDKLEDFGACFDRFGDVRTVLLGEATHGSSEFYRARAAITRRLIERHGSTVVAVEADWPDAARIDDYGRHLAPRPRRGDMFVRFPTWMWRNQEVLAFADWLRRHNRDISEERQASFHGLDIYSLSESIHAVLAYLDKVDPSEAESARRRYGRDRAELRDALSPPLLERAIGVVYRPETERLSHYFEAVMAEEFDAEVWFEQTSAVSPLGTERPMGAPETSPFGL